MKKLIILVLLLAPSVILSQSKITLKTNFDDVNIYQIVGESKTSVGVGTAPVRLSKKEINKFMFVKEGYETLIREFPRTKKWPKTVLINMRTRVVQVDAKPFDAELYLDGKSIGKKSAEIKIPEGENVTLEVRKQGFSGISKTYYNEETKPVPPIKEEIMLTDREVQVKTNPLDSQIIVDKQNQGMGTTKVIIPKDKCVLVESVKEGYIKEEKVFCNKEGEYIPLNHSFALEDRLVSVSSSPDDVELVVKGKVVGIGNYDLKIPKGKCVEINFKKEGYINTKKNYCNRNDYQDPPMSDFVELIEDEAYATSISTDLANVRFNVDVREGISELNAWKILNQIITTEFDVIEVIQRETGYLRTAWQVQSFNGNSTIRTRVIVSLVDSNPLIYGVKISSERADGIVSAKEDQKFTEWNRLLRKYKNIIEEAQIRL